MTNSQLDRMVEAGMREAYGGDYYIQQPGRMDYETVSHGTRNRFAAAVLAAGMGLSFAHAYDSSPVREGVNTEASAPGTGANPEIGIDGTLISAAQDIYETQPGTGSCSPWTRADVAAIEAGTMQKPTVDLLGKHGSQLAMFKQNPEFASNFANSLPGFVYEATGVNKQSATAEQAVMSVIESDYFVTGQLAKDIKSINHFCDDQGNVRPTSEGVVTLPKDTYVAGFIIESQAKNAQGQMVTKFKNGREVVLPKNAQIAEVKDAAGKTVLMLVTNKAGINTDGDWAPEVGCFNPQLAPEVREKEDEKAPDTTLPPTTSPTTAPPKTTPPTTAPPKTTPPTTAPPKTTPPTTAPPTTAPPTTAPPTTVPDKVPQPPVTGGPSTTVEAPVPGPSVPTTMFRPPTTEVTPTSQSPNTSTAPTTGPERPVDTSAPVTTVKPPSNSTPPPTFVENIANLPNNPNAWAVMLGSGILGLVIGRSPDRKRIQNRNAKVMN